MKLKVRRVLLLALDRLKIFADVEGGADCWPRPKIDPIDEKRDAISKRGHTLPCACPDIREVFQQLDVEDCYDGGTVGFRMFGVTEASSFSARLWMC